MLVTSVSMDDQDDTLYGFAPPTLLQVQCWRPGQQLLQLPHPLLDHCLSSLEPPDSASAAS
jgi:hypothetical protein